MKRYTELPTLQRFGSDVANIQPIVYWYTLKRHSIWWAYQKQIWILHVTHESGRKEILKLRCEVIQFMGFTSRGFWKIKHK